MLRDKDTVYDTVAYRCGRVYVEREWSWSWCRGAGSGEGVDREVQGVEREWEEYECE